MRLHEFNRLPLAARADILYEWGFFISCHKTDGINNVLYAINGFFAEERISMLNNEVLEIIGYNSHELSAKNLETIRKRRAFLLMAPGVIHPGNSDITAAA
jgi:hypothetical protein